MEYSFIEISNMQKQSLSEKIEFAIKAIQEGFRVSAARPALAFSGGKDSTVLWHIIKSHFPVEASKMAIIFGNTNVEYPESLKFARQIGAEWGGDSFHEATPERLKKDGLKYEAQKRVLDYLIETKKIKDVLKKDGKLKTTEALEKACPKEMWAQFEREGLVWKAGTLKSYWWCVDQFGWPIMGKETGRLTARRINIDCFLTFSETASTDEELIQYYDLLRKVKLSQACCNELKKKPSIKLEKELGIDLSFMGLMAAESYRRKKLFASRGYLYEMKTKYKFNNRPFYHCNPLSTWTDDDIWEYINRYNVPYAPLYDLKYNDENGAECRMKRNGCIGCYTDYGRKNSHMYVLRQTHPSRWKAVMNYGMAAEIQKLRAHGTSCKISKTNYSRLSILKTLESFEGVDYENRIAWAIENRPCAFD